MANSINKFCIEVYITCIPPEQWTANVIVPLPKKGDPGPMINY